MTTPASEPIDGGTPESASSPAVPTLDEFRTYVGATQEDDDVLVRDLEEAVAHVDDFLGPTPMRPVPDPIRRKWYLQVAAEIFDSSTGPSAVSDRFGVERQVRSSRDPLHVIMRDARRYVGYF